MKPSSGLRPWQEFIDGLQEAIWLIDVQSHCVLFSNAAAARLARCSQESFTGRHVLEIACTPQDVAFWNEPAQVVTQGMDSVSGLLRSDGVLLSVERRITAFSLPGFEPMLLMSMVECSAQQTGQRELENSLAQLRSTLDSAADGMLVCGLDGSVQAFNLQLACIWKMPQSLLVRRNDDAIYAFMASRVSDPNVHAQRIRALAMEPEARGSDLIALRDGRTLERRSVPQICFGSVTGRVFSFRDITAELEWQADLRLAAQAFECSADAIFIADSTHRLVRVNPSGEILLGRPLHELQGCKVVELLQTTGSFQADVQAQVQEAWAQSDVWSSEVLLERSDGACAVHLSWVAVRDASGQMVKSVGFLRDLTEQKKTQQRIFELAYIDVLSGLPNRLLLAQQVEADLQKHASSARRFAVMCLDLDCFKVINDSLGHAFGDRVSQLVAARLHSSLRPGDMLCRMGGDEFVMYLRECGREMAETVVRRILDEMHCPFTLDGIGFSIQCSIGVAMCPQDGHALDDLIEHADTARYRAKSQGRGRYGFYKPEMNVHPLQRMQMEHAMRQALEHGHMAVHYQPQVQLGTHTIVGAEALLRWNDPDLGSVPPAVFMVLAEKSGYIVTLGAWVLEQAVQQAVCWLCSGTPMLVSVNVSALEFRQPGFVERVAHLLQLHGLPAPLLELEVTESTLMQDTQEAARRLAVLAALGVSLALDNFGTGCFSLAYLKNLPIHKLKVDQSFVRGLPSDGGDHAMVSAIVHMGHALGMGVVAEGVETRAQLTVLDTLGCDYFQGDLCAAAMAPYAFEALLASKKHPL